MRPVMVNGDSPRYDVCLSFLKAKFEGPLGRPLVLTSEVNIIPDTLPYPRCHGEGCYETLV